MRYVVRWEFRNRKGGVDSDWLNSLEEAADYACRALRQEPSAIWIADETGRIVADAEAIKAECERRERGEGTVN